MPADLGWRCRELWPPLIPPGSYPIMQIYGPFRVSTAQNTPPAQRTQPQPPAESAGAKSAAPTDQLDLSSNVGSTNRIAATEIAGGGEIRIDRVAEIRRQIADGNYETAEKIDAALDKFLDQYA